MNVEIAGESLTLLSDRTVFWKRARTLLLADPHFGKPESFRAVGVPVPAGSTSDSLRRIHQALRVCGAERLIVLGDFWHARAGVTVDLLDELTAWRHSWADLQIELVLGNHDGGRYAIPEAWDFEIHRQATVRSPFVLSHYPRPSDEGYVLAGHLHPAFRIRGRGRQSLRLPCFWFGAGVGVLPAFGGFTGTASIEPARGDRIFVIADHEVIALPGSTR